MGLQITSHTKSTGASILNNDFSTTSTSYVTAISLSVPNNMSWASAHIYRYYNVSVYAQTRILQNAVQLKEWPLTDSTPKSVNYVGKNTSGAAVTIAIEAKTISAANPTYVAYGSGIVYSSWLAVAYNNNAKLAVDMYTNSVACTISADKIYVTALLPTHVSGGAEKAITFISVNGLSFGTKETEKTQDINSVVREFKIEYYINDATIECAFCVAIDFDGSLLKVV